MPEGTRSGPALTEPLFSSWARPAGSPSPSTYLLHGEHGLRGQAGLRSGLPFTKRLPGLGPLETEGANLVRVPQGLMVSLEEQTQKHAETCKWLQLQ